MNEILTMVIGALLGAIISPAVNRIVESRFSSDKKCHFRSGLILLSAANATWLVSYIVLFLFHHDKSIQAFLGIITFFLIATFFFIFSFSHFQKANEISNQTIVKKLLYFLMFGNLLWLLAEMAEFLMVDWFESKLIRAISYIPAICLFSFGIIKGLRKNETE